MAASCRLPWRASAQKEKSSCDKDGPGENVKKACGVHFGGGAERFALSPFLGTIQLCFIELANRQKRPWLAIKTDTSAEAAPRGMERHPQNKVQDDLYAKAVGNLKELNTNVGRMNELLAETNRTNETAVLVSQLNSAYLDGISFQLDLQKKGQQNDDDQKGPPSSG